MLIQFIVENFMCFAEETVFSMAASTEIEQHKEHLIQLTPETNLLRTSVLYGANAHGKTKLIDLAHPSYIDKHGESLKVLMERKKLLDVLLKIRFLSCRLDNSLFLLNIF
ncbi:hypothetical protein QUF74_19490 [Candidatus Halobeggiatoa sp. HSG11]|nr:hypothetical protein [Candidatus Halobeggiatoa sp. HSG11]